MINIRQSHLVTSRNREGRRPEGIVIQDIYLITIRRWFSNPKISTRGKCGWRRRDIQSRSFIAVSLGDPQVFTCHWSSCMHRSRDVTFWVSRHFIQDKDMSLHITIPASCTAVEMSGSGFQDTSYKTTTGGNKWNRGYIFPVVCRGKVMPTLLKLIDWMSLPPPHR